MSLEEGVFIVPKGKPCWGCKKLVTEKIPMKGEDFICGAWDPGFLIGRIRKIMEGCIVPREILKGCYKEKENVI